MTRVASILSPERIRIDQTAGSKAELYQELGRLFAAWDGLDPARVTASLLARENLGCTALGHGVALPHARLKGLQQAHGAFVRLRTPLSFGAVDGKPISDVLVVLVPEHAVEEHLKMLAEAAEMFSDRRFLNCLHGRTDAAAVWQAFADWQPSTARPASAPPSISK